MKDPNVITDVFSVADSGLRRRFERTQRSSSAESIGRQKTGRSSRQKKAG
jgi:hypothetical protein